MCKHNAEERQFGKKNNLVTKATKSGTYIGRVKLPGVSDATCHQELERKPQSRAKKVFLEGCFQLLSPLT